MKSPIKISSSTGNTLLWIAGGAALIGLASYAYSRVPKRVGVNGIQNASQAQLQTLAEKLHKSIDGITIIDDVPAYQQAVALGDADFTRLYNIYNEMFQGQDGETMTAAVAGEFAWIGNYSFQVIQTEFLAKCAALNLP